MSKSSSNLPPDPSQVQPWRKWISPRRKRFWAIVAVVLYTLCGFLLVPWIVKSGVIDAAQDRAGRTATIEKVKFNPYVLSLEVNGLEVEDPDGQKLAGLDRLFVNFQLSSLFRWAWTFREITLDGLDWRIERFAPGDSRLTRLLADIEARAGEPEPEEPSAGLPRLLILELNLNDGRVEMRDDVPEQPVDLTLGPITIDIEQLNTLPDRYGQQMVKVRMPHDATITWQGDLSLAPFRSEGTFRLDKSHLNLTTAYLEAVLPIEDMNAILSVNTNYRIEETADGAIEVELNGLEAKLEDVRLRGLAPAADFLSFPSLKVSGGTFRYPDRTLTLSEVHLSNPALEAWFDPSGALSLSQFAPGEAASANAPQTDTGASPEWRIEVGAFDLDGGTIAFADKRIEPPGSVELQDIDLSVRSISNASEAEFPTVVSTALGGGGTLGFEGTISVLPDFTASGTAQVNAVPLTLAQPYLQQKLNVLIKTGTIDATSKMTLAPDTSVKAGGSIEVRDLEVVDTAENQPLVGWKGFGVDQFDADTAGQVYKFSRLTFTRPFGRLAIHPDRTTNLSGLLVTASPSKNADGATTAAGSAGTAPSPSESGPSPTVVLGGVQVTDGALDFSDRSLPLPFAAQIRNLGGNVTTIDTSSATPATLQFEGQVNEYGLARINGDMNLLDALDETDVKMEFRNLLMSGLSPYTAEFAGREIAEGKLDLDLQYRIEKGKMLGKNNIVMSDLVLGDKIESPDAADLPLGLAVALLKDANGVIDIDLPVEGDVNDPEFRIGGVIWQAFVGLITKVVTAPFRLLGALVGVESEDFGQFQFLAGRSDLTPPELEKIVKLQEALAQRPELSIEISGPYVPDVDRPALQFQQLKDAIIQRLGEKQPADLDEAGMLDDHVRTILEALFNERFPDVSLDSVRAEHTAPPADKPDGKPVLDGLAYATDLRDRLLASEKVADAALKALATARAEALRSAFLADGTLDASRIQMSAPTETESEDGEWVDMELGIAQ